MLKFHQLEMSEVSENKQIFVWTIFFHIATRTEIPYHIDITTTCETISIGYIKEVIVQCGYDLSELDRILIEESVPGGMITEHLRAKVICWKIPPSTIVYRENTPLRLFLQKGSKKVATIT
jgi:hypothetical protein